MNEEQNKIIKKLIEEFEYTEKELKNDFDWICIEEDKGMWGNVFFNGDYVMFAEDKVIWY